MMYTELLYTSSHESSLMIPWSDFLCIPYIIISTFCLSRPLHRTLAQFQVLVVQVFSFCIAFLSFGRLLTKVAGTHQKKAEKSVLIALYSPSYNPVCTCYN